MPMIIFEGPDGGGKSTAIEYLTSTPSRNGYPQLGEKEGWEVHHHGAYEGVDDTYPLYSKTVGDGMILDRSWISELPYGEVYRGNVRLGHGDWEQLQLRSHLNGAVVVMCMPTFITCEANFLARKHKDPDSEYLHDSAQLFAVYRRFTQMLVSGELAPLPIILYNYEAHTLEQLRQLIGVYL